MKTVKLDIALDDDCRINDIIISGDFFAYPEDSIEVLEEQLRGCSNASCIEQAFSALKSSVILGVDIESVKQKIIETVKECHMASSTLVRVE